MILNKDNKLAISLQDQVVVVTGGGGYIGSAIINELEKYSVRIIRISRSVLIPKSGIEDWVLDLNKETSWNKIVSEADIIFHLAGNTSVYAAEQNPEDSLASSLFPVTYLVKAAKELSRIPRVIFASTATVYGLANDLPVVENISANPLTVYDLHKLFVEQHLAMAHREGFISAISLRLANVYGPGVLDNQPMDRGILNKITQWCLAGQTIHLYGGGDYLRDYIYIDDVVNAFIRAVAIKNTHQLSYNIASGVGVTIKKVFALIANEAELLTDKRVKLDTVPWPTGVSSIEKRNFIGSNDSFRLLSGWCPSTSLQDGIKKLVRYHQISGINNAKS